MGSAGGCSSKDCSELVATSVRQISSFRVLASSSDRLDDAGVQVRTGAEDKVKIFGRLIWQFIIGFAVGALFLVPVALHWPARLMPDGKPWLALVLAYGVGLIWTFVYFVWSFVRPR